MLNYIWVIIMQKGLVQIYTGSGKGKTTASMGLGFRAVGCGMSVKVVQFLKTSETGELTSCEMFGDRFNIYRFGTVRGFYNTMTDEQKLITHAEVRTAFEFAKKLANECDLLILDEIFGAISNELITEDELCNFISSKPANVELVLTGRNAPKSVISLADYVSEINAIKHPFEKGVSSRRGIEY